MKEGSGGLEVGRKGGWKKLEGLDDQEGRLEREVYLVRRILHAFLPLPFRSRRGRPLTGNASFTLYLDVGESY